MHATLCSLSSNTHTQFQVISPIANNTTCPNLLFYCLYRTLTKSNSGRKGLIWLTLPNHSSLLREAKAGIWRQTLKQSPWRNTAYWLASCGSLSSRFYTTQNHRAMGGRHSPTNQLRQCPTDLPIGHPDGSISSAEVAPYQGTVAVSSWQQTNKENQSK